MLPFYIVLDELELTSYIRSDMILDLLTDVSEKKFLFAFLKYGTVKKIHFKAQKRSSSVKL